MLRSRAKHISVTVAPYMKEYNVNKQSTKASWKVLKVTALFFLPSGCGGGGGEGGKRGVEVLYW